MFSRKPHISFLKAFGSPVSILNTTDPLSKFAPKADDGHFVGYSSVSKAYRVFNKSAYTLQETTDVVFFEHNFKTKCIGPEWIFDMDSFMKSFDISPSDEPSSSGTFDDEPKITSYGGGWIKPQFSNVSPINTHQM